MASNYPTGNNNGAGGGQPPSAPSNDPVATLAQILLQQQQQQQQTQTSQQLQAAGIQQQQQQQLLSTGPFYTLQQQQAFAQARLAAAATSTSSQVVGHQHQQVYAAAPYSNLMGQQQQQQQQGQDTPVNNQIINSAPVVVGGASIVQQQQRTDEVTTNTHTNTAAAAKSSSDNTTNTPKVSKATTTVVKEKKLPPPVGTMITSSSENTSGLSTAAAKLIQNAMVECNNCDIPSATPPASSSAALNNTSSSPGNNNSTNHQTPEDKKQSSRDRNREHARCTRLRKKAYVNKLKELVDGLHAERTEDERKRRVAVQKLAEVQALRRKVVHTFLDYHSKYECDRSKWNRILETGDGETGEVFKLKQPVTPFRSFSRSEIQKGSRILKGVDAMIRDSASMSVMIETIGSRNLRWLQRKRDDFLTRDHHTSSSNKNRHPQLGTARVGLTQHREGGGHNVGNNSSGTSASGNNMPTMVRQNSRLQYQVSSLSSSSGSGSGSGSSAGNGSGSEEERRLAQRRKTDSDGLHTTKHSSDDNNNNNNKNMQSSTKAKQVSSSSGSSNDTQAQRLHVPHHGASNDFHDYHAPSLLDPLPESGGSSPSSDSPDGMDSDNCVAGGKHMCTDSSSGEEEKQANPSKKIKTDANQAVNAAVATTKPSSLPPNIAKSGILHNVKVAGVGATSSSNTVASLPNGRRALSSRAPKTAELPPFVGIGKKRKHPADMNDQSNNTSSSSDDNSMVPILHKPSTNNNNNINNGDSNMPSSSKSNSHNNAVGSNIITINDNQSTSSQSSSQHNRGIQAHYYINEDDMIITDDILMCPFIFRSQEAVWCGALAECVQPGMLRASFSSTNKLRDMEMIFDAMGFCQQLERASGNEGMAQIIPNSLEMALTPNSEEARVITLAKAPFSIVSVNETWTRVTGYTQLDVEGKDMSILHGERTGSDACVRGGMPPHDFENVAKGICAASTNIHYDINGREFLDFMCSYPLSNLKNEVTHILHICQELPART